MEMQNIEAMNEGLGTRSTLQLPHSCGRICSMKGSLPVEGIGAVRSLCVCAFVGLTILPIVPPIVASATGGIISGHLPNPQYALWTLIVSYSLWGTGLPLAMMVLVIYFQRLTI